MRGMEFDYPEYKQDLYESAKFKRTVKRVSKALLKLQKKLKFQAIVFTGTSGAGIAYPVSYLTGLKIVCVRKKNDSSHGYKLEGKVKASRYIILDDFISCGDTVSYILKTIDEYSSYTDEAKCVGIALYRDKERNGDMWREKIPIFAV